MLRAWQWAGRETEGKSGAEGEAGGALNNIHRPGVSFQRFPLSSLALRLRSLRAPTKDYLVNGYTVGGRPGVHNHAMLSLRRG